VAQGEKQCQGILRDLDRVKKSKPSKVSETTQPSSAAHLDSSTNAIPICTSSIFFMYAVYLSNVIHPHSSILVAAETDRGVDLHHRQRVEEEAGGSSTADYHHMGADTFVSYRSFIMSSNHVALRRAGGAGEYPQV
jgi:hypothetical protein